MLFFRIRHFRFQFLFPAHFRMILFIIQHAPSTRIVEMDTPCSEERIVAAIEAEKLTNVVLVSGDWHVYSVMDVLQDFEDPTSEVVVTEFGGVRVSDVGPWVPVMKGNLFNNTHVRYIEDDDLRGRVNVHGFTTCHITSNNIITELRSLDNVKAISAFAVRHGVAGATLCTALSKYQFMLEVYALKPTTTTLCQVRRQGILRGDT